RALDAPQVDLAQDAAVVPPAADRAAGDVVARGREVAALAARVDADDQPVRAVAPQRPGRDDELERQVRTGVGAKPLAVEPHPGPVVDRLEPDDPRVACGAARKTEVLAVPADAAVHRGLRLVGRVPGVG